MSLAENIAQWIQGFYQETEGKIEQSKGGIKGGLQGTADEIAGKFKKRSAEAKINSEKAQDRDLEDSSIW